MPTILTILVGLLTNPRAIAEIMGHAVDLVKILKGQPRAVVTEALGKGEDAVVKHCEGVACETELKNI